MSVGAIVVPGAVASGRGARWRRVVVRAGLACWLVAHAVDAGREASTPPGREASPPPVTSSDEVPRWARATAGDGLRHVAGQVRLYGHGARATVHLRLDVPDARVWAGRTVRTGPDGHFDFGLLPAARYVVVALGPLGSRVIDVDARHDDRARVAVTVRPCVQQRGRVVGATLDERLLPLAGAAIEVAGLRVASTDGRGDYRWCAPPDLETIDVRARGWIPVTEWLFPWWQSYGLPWNGRSSGEVELLPTRARWRRRLVDDTTGEPYAGVALRPRYRISDHGYGLPPTQLVTDEDGGFDADDVLPGAPGWPDELAYHTELSVVDGRHGGRWLWLDPEGAIEVLRRPSPARLRGRVVRAGVPLVDARVRFVRRGEWNGDYPSTRTDLDGRFELEHQAGRLTVELDDGTTAEAVLRPGELGELEVDLARSDAFVVTARPSGHEPYTLVFPGGVYRSSGEDGSLVAPHAGWARLWRDGDRGPIWLSPDAAHLDDDLELDRHNRAATRARPCPSRPLARITGGPSADDLALGFTDDGERGGARVSTVGGAAAAAGLQVGDLITAVDGDVLRDLDREGLRLTETIPPCTDVTFTVVRDGRTRTIRIPGTY